MKNPYDVIKSLIRTEKGVMQEPLRKYQFWVEIGANKIEIRKAVEEIYKIKVDSVNTLMLRGKRKRVRYKTGKTPDWKKAIVTLKPGEKIEVT